MKKLSVVQNELPDPPYPEDTQANGFPISIYPNEIYESIDFLVMPADIQIWALAAILRSWQNKPCGSLESDIRALAARLRCSVSFLEQHRESILAGWYKASDGRLYHPYVAEQVKGFADRREVWRNSKRKSRKKSAKDKAESTNVHEESTNVHEESTRVHQESTRVHEESTGVHDVSTHVTASSSSSSSSFNSPPIGSPPGGNVFATTTKTKKPRKVFSPPALEEVEAYAEEYVEVKGLDVDAVEIAQRFHDHFSSNGWKVGGKTTMVDWKASLRGFFSRQKDWNGQQKAAGSSQMRSWGRGNGSGTDCTLGVPNSQIAANLMAGEDYETAARRILRGGR